MKLEFKPCSWLSECERFSINTAYPSGFCASDWKCTRDEYDEPIMKVFTKTFEEAVAWCQERAKR